MSTEATPRLNDLPARVLASLTDLGVDVTPQAFAVWYAHLSGTDTTLSAKISELVSSKSSISGDVIAELHDVFIANGNQYRLAERSSRSVMMEIDGIVELIKLSLGSTTHYSTTLSKLLSDLVTSTEPAHLRQIVQALVSATEETRVANEGLQKGLRHAKAEVDDLRKLLENARQETLKDGLTGISNRRHFEQELHSTIEDATENRRNFALLMIDIDNFKSFNDTHGHLTGDKVLKVVAHALRSKFPSTATVARYGGEEFAVILPNSDLMAGWVGAEAVRQSILGRELVKRSTGERIGRITVSIGVGAWKRTDTALSLIGRTDAALYQAKRQGRNQTLTEDQIRSAVA